MLVQTHYFSSVAVLPEPIGKNFVLHPFLRIEVKHSQSYKIFPESFA